MWGEWDREESACLSFSGMRELLWQRLGKRGKGDKLAQRLQRYINLFARSFLLIQYSSHSRDKVAFILRCKHVVSSQ